MVLPTLNENFGHVIWESLAAGCPVLLSDQTPWRDLSSKGAGWDIPLNSPEIFVEQLQRVAQMTEEELNRYRQAAFALAKSSASQSDLEAVYSRAFSPHL